MLNLLVVQMSMGYLSQLKLEMKKSPQEVVDYYYNLIDNSFKEFGISFDIFSRTSKDIHHKTSSDSFLTYMKKAYLKKLHHLNIMM